MRLRARRGSSSSRRPRTLWGLRPVEGGGSGRAGFLLPRRRPLADHPGSQDSATSPTATTPSGPGPRGRGRGRTVDRRSRRVGVRSCGRRPTEWKHISRLRRYRPGRADAGGGHASGVERTRRRARLILRGRRRPSLVPSRPGPPLPARPAPPRPAESATGGRPRSGSEGPSGARRRSRGGRAPGSPAAAAASVKPPGATTEATAAAVAAAGHVIPSPSSDARSRRWRRRDPREPECDGG